MTGPNDRRLAREMRENFIRHEVFVVHLVSHPGSRIPEVLIKALMDLQSSYRTAVVVTGSRDDAEVAQLTACGAAVCRIPNDQRNGLHAGALAGAVRRWDLDSLDFLFIDDPAGPASLAVRDLGQRLRILVSSDP